MIRWSSQSLYFSSTPAFI